MATRDCSAELCFVDCLTPTTPRADSKSIAKARSHTAKHFWRKRCLSQGLLTIQPDGNSDSLGSIATPLTARIASAIHFRKTQYVPACPFSRTPISFVHRQETRTKFIRKELSELNKPNSAKAFILHLMSMYAQISNNDVEWRQDILRLRVDSVNIVRKAIECGMYQDVTNAIHWLFADAVLTANLGEALLHGEALRELLMSAKDIDQSTLINALCLDSHLAIMFMRRTIFDPSWASEQFNAKAEVSSTLHEGCKIECSLPIDLAEIVTQFNSTSATSRCSDRNLESRDESEAVGWAVADNHIRKSRLMNFYVDNSESLVGCMALAILCLEMTQGCDPKFRGKRLMPSLPKLMDRLYSSMRNRVKPANAELWCLYVGALIEQRELTYATEAWFNRAFASVAWRMGLSSWTQILNILKRFLYSELIDPAGDTWVEKTLQANIEDVAEPPAASIPSWVHLNGESVELGSGKVLDCLSG